MPRSDPAQFAAEGVRNIASAFQPAMEALGKDIQSDMRQIISVPVQYVEYGSERPAKPAPIGNRPGPGLTNSPDRLHKVVIRSKQGEAPRKEYGLLYKSMITWTITEAERITTFMGSDDSIAGYAEKLEEQLDRPHFSTIFKRVQSYAVDRILSRSPKTI